MDANRFDDLTRALARGTSRRQALKVLGGGLLAALVPGSVFAAKGGNSTCAKFCADTFGADTPAAKQCTSEAAKGRGLCYSCGPASNNQGALCGQTCCTTSVANATATCNSGTCGFTCNAGYQPCNGTCIATNECCGACLENETCQDGTCVPVTNRVICNCEGRTVGSCPVACADGQTHCTDLCASDNRILLSFTCDYEAACLDG
jgi:hypothetical protein